MNDEWMRQQYDLTAPIETLYQQIENAVEYALAGSAMYNLDQILSKAYFLLFRTGLYVDAC